MREGNTIVGKTSIHQMNTTCGYDALARLTGIAERTVTAAYGPDLNWNQSYVECDIGVWEEYTQSNASGIYDAVDSVDNITMSFYLLLYKVFPYV